MESTRNTEILEQWDHARQADPTLTPVSFISQEFGGSDSVEASHALRLIQDYEKGRELADLFASDSRDLDESHNVVASQELALGLQPVAGYELVRKLGSGGYGEVWEAMGPGGFPVAMKFIGSSSTSSDQLRELEIAKQAKHPNLIATHGAWRLDESVAVAMELADQTLGDFFRDRLKAGHAGIERNELVRFLKDAASGIDFLNGEPHKIQHRDIKPDNILLVGGGAKVADFGISRIVSGDSTGHTGAMTVAYSAPETFDGRTSRHSDQYSLAVTYVYLLTGDFPFSGSPQQIMRGHTSGTPELGKLSEADRDIVTKALSKNPSERWSSCTDFVDALAESGSSATAFHFFGRTKRPQMYVLWTACAIVALLVGRQFIVARDKISDQEVSSVGSPQAFHLDADELARRIRKPASESIAQDIPAMTESFNRLGREAKATVPSFAKDKDLNAKSIREDDEVLRLLVDAVHFRTQPVAVADGEPVDVLMQIDEEGYARLASAICDSLQEHSISSGEALLGFATATLDPIIRHDLLDNALNNEIVEALSKRTQCVVIVASEVKPTAWGSQEDTDLRRGRGGQQTANATWFAVADNAAAPIQRAFRQLRALQLETRDSLGDQLVVEPLRPFKWEESHGRDDTSFLPGGPVGSVFSPGMGGGNLSIIGARRSYETTLGRNPSTAIPLDEERVTLILPKFIDRGEFTDHVVVGRVDSGTAALELCVNLALE
ncbi:serine/threonine protein kinase [Roseiconus lacunae]|uniref:Serine/threonine-protein kinase n=1 Tax=Roseiconus lacunae TaxID=2605694 RepID=A0ABT7PPG9_9BACT|nr:serine/threonine-protein kinase [Roseiconus lacunae]MDM4018206.1 serine/threonine-protein kinase [Roseiconus lacunae]